MPSINKRLALTSSSSKTSITLSEQQQELEREIQRLTLVLQRYVEQQKEYSQQKSDLTDQIALATQKIIWNKQHLSQQASMAFLRQSELKESDESLRAQIVALLERQARLPQLISDVRQRLLQNQKSLLPPAETPAGQLQHTQRALIEQQLANVKAEFALNPQRLELSQLSLQLVRAQLLQQEQLIESLNKAIAEERQAITAATIADSQIETSVSSSPFTVEINSVNKELADQLRRLNLRINHTVDRQEIAEKQYQRQTRQLSNIQEQITWAEMSSAFGERFLQMLNALPKPASLEVLQAELADIRLTRYRAEQQLSLNNQEIANINQLSGEDFSATHVKLLNAQNKLLEQVLTGHDSLLSELAKLRISYEQLNLQLQILKNTLNEQLFWVPNASSINKLWLTELHQSIAWFFHQNHWYLLSASFDDDETYWSWWIILFVLCLAAQDILTPHFNRATTHFASFVGKVTQDKFIYTFKALVSEGFYALIKPLPIILAGFILLQSHVNYTHAIGTAVFFMGLLYLLYRFTTLLTNQDGLLIGHFKSPKTVINQCFIRFQQFYFIAMPLIGIVGFTQTLELSLVRNSIGRVAFIALSIMLFLFYKDLLKISLQYRQFHLDGKNKKLLQKILWGILLLVPLLSAGLAFNGFYYTALQMLTQLQMSLLIGLGFLLLYQLIKRWMLIARRQIAFERAKTKRAEQLAARERGETVGASLDPIDNYEEPVVDLETISSQSLGLVRSLLVLALIASLLGLWTQTHAALFSFFDGITLWTSTTFINGIEQEVPVTIKSVMFGMIIVGFSLMIATNLPGLLELMLLQRLELSPGTGFAITTVSRYVVVFFGLLIGFSTLGMEWSKLQWLVAALSVGLGFGLQEIFANFISGLIILFEKPIRIGDTVTIRELTGTVSKIQIRATTIIDWDRKEIIVPNKAFITEQLVNWSLSDPITRVQVYVSVARDSDPSKVEAALYQAVQECEDALNSPEPEVWFAGFGQHTQDFEVRAYAKDMSSRWPLKHKLHKRITKKLKENDLVLAYPQMEIHINNAAKESSGLLRS